MTTVEAPESHLRENPFQIARAQLRRVADIIEIDGIVGKTRTSTLGSRHSIAFVATADRNKWAYAHTSHSLYRVSARGGEPADPLEGGSGGDEILRRRLQ